MDERTVVKKLRDQGYDKLTNGEKDELEKIFERRKGQIVEAGPEDEQRHRRVIKLVTVSTTILTTIFTADEKTLVDKLKALGYEKLSEEEKVKLDKLYTKNSTLEDAERKKRLTKLTKIITTETIKTETDRLIIAKLKDQGYESLTEEDKEILEAIYQTIKSTIPQSDELDETEKKRLIKRLIKVIKIETITTIEIKRIIQKAKEQGYEQLSEDEKYQLLQLFDTLKASIPELTETESAGHTNEKNKAIISLVNILTSEEKDTIRKLRKLNTSERLTEEQEESAMNDEDKESRLISLVASFIGNLNEEEIGALDRLQQYRISAENEGELSETDTNLLKKFGINTSIKVTLVQSLNGSLVPHYMLPQNRDVTDKQPIIPERKHFIEKQHSKADVTVEGPKEPHFQDKENQPVHEAHPTEAKHILQDREFKHDCTVHEHEKKAPEHIDHHHEPVSPQIHEHIHGSVNKDRVVNQDVTVTQEDETKKAKVTKTDTTVKRTEKIQDESRQDDTETTFETIVQSQSGSKKIDQTITKSRQVEVEDTPDEIIETTTTITKIVKTTEMKLIDGKAITGEAQELKYEGEQFAVEANASSETRKRIVIKEEKSETVDGETEFATTLDTIQGTNNNSKKVTKYLKVEEEEGSDEDVETTTTVTKTVTKSVAKSQESNATRHTEHSQQLSDVDRQLIKMEQDQNKDGEVIEEVLDEHGNVIRRKIIKSTKFFKASNSQLISEDIVNKTEKVTQVTNSSHSAVMTAENPKTNTRVNVIRRPIIGPNGEEGEEIIEETITETYTETVEDASNAKPLHAQITADGKSQSTTTKTVQKSSSTVVGENVKPGTNTKTNVIRRPIVGPNGQEGEEIIEETITETITETVEEVDEKAGHSFTKPKKDTNAQTSSSSKTFQQSSSSTTHGATGSNNKSMVTKKTSPKDNGEESYEETTTTTVTEEITEEDENGNKRVTKPATVTNSNTQASQSSTSNEWKSSNMGKTTGGHGGHGGHGDQVSESTSKQVQTSYYSSEADGELGTKLAKKVLEEGEGKNRKEDKKVQSKTEKKKDLDADGNEVEIEEVTESTTTTVEYEIDEEESSK